MNARRMIVGLVSVFSLAIVGVIFACASPTLTRADQTTGLRIIVDTALVSDGDVTLTVVCDPSRGNLVYIARTQGSFASSYNVGVSVVHQPETCNNKK